MNHTKLNKLNSAIKTQIVSLDRKTKSGFMLCTRNMLTTKTVITHKKWKKNKPDKNQPKETWKNGVSGRKHY